MTPALNQSALCFASVKTQPTPREISQFYLLQTDTLEYIYTAKYINLSPWHWRHQMLYLQHSKSADKSPSLTSPEVQREPNSCL